MNKNQGTCAFSLICLEYSACHAAATRRKLYVEELHSPVRRATLVYCDNVNACYLSTIPVQHQRTKHIEIDLHFIRDKVAVGAVRVLHVPTTSQYTDFFTKGLPSLVFTEFCTSLTVSQHG
jgi:hypothetical protein